MTKTSLLSLVGAASGLALFVLGFSFDVVREATPRAVAWEQPPVCIPKPSAGIKVLSTEAVGASLVAWEQPPVCIPKPSGGIKVLSTEAVDALQVAWEQPPVCIPKPSGGIKVLTTGATV